MDVRILRKKDFLPRLGYSMATLDRKIRIGEFPPPLILGPNMRGWYEDVIDTYINSLHSNISNHQPPSGDQRGHKPKTCTVIEVESESDVTQSSVTNAMTNQATNDGSKCRVNIIQAESSNATASLEIQTYGAIPGECLSDVDDDYAPPAAIMAVAMLEEMNDLGVEKISEDKACCLLNDTWVTCCSGESLTPQILSELMQIFPIAPREVKCGGQFKKMYSKADLTEYAAA